MTSAELILYATPTGPLADALDQLFLHLDGEARSTAQDYPPHCTLTGFFRRDDAEIPRILTEVETALTEPDRRVGTVEVVALHRRADWVGLEIRSDWLREVTGRFADIHVVGPSDDALRMKDWLHLSIAYGSADLGAVIAATERFDHLLAASWEVALWQRHPDGAWSRLGEGHQ